MDPRKLSIADYTYPLPDDRIAAYPKAERDRSRLLIYQNGAIGDDVFSNIAEYLPAEAMIIFNNARVIEARLLFEKPTGARIEVFCLEPGPQAGDIASALNTQGSVVWKCLIGNASAWTAGLVLEKKIGGLPNPLVLKAKIAAFKEDHFLVELSWNPPTLSFAEVLHATGIVPLPPYIKRKPEQSDAERYQTVFATSPGSVAAPTAGLHFTPQTLQQLANKNIRQDFVTLHVGAGTFKPVKSEVMNDHSMHAEFIEITISLVENLLQHLPRPVVAVGTTSLRTLESAYWVGKKIMSSPGSSAEELHVGQWEPYEKEDKVTTVTALETLLHWMRSTGTQRLIIKTGLLIAPGYRFRLVDMLVTNFHQPRSTLLLLVAAFIGEKWKSVYSYALENDFRFLSYGDACLLFRQEPPL